jgi:hypothetical protein
MGLLPDFGTPDTPLARPAGLIGAGPALPRQHVAADMLLQNAEVQYVWRPAARQCTVDQFTALAVWFGFLKPF